MIELERKLVAFDCGVIRLTPAQRRDLALVAAGNICSKTEPVPFRMETNHFYAEYGGSNRITDKMMNKLEAADLIEPAESYKDRHPGSGWTQWGRFVRATTKGRKLIGV